MFRRLFRKKPTEEEIAEELEAHLALHRQMLQERGVSESEAEVHARRALGNKTLIAERAREAWISVWFEGLLQDLRYAWRNLRHNAAFASATVLSIALAIGAGTAVYSIADTVFLRPLPYPRPEQLTWVAVRFPKMNIEFVGSPDFVAWRRDNHSFQELAATQAMGGEVMLLNGSNAAEVHNIRVSADFLRTLGIRPWLGHDFRMGDESPTGAKTVLLTDHLWEQRFHRDRSIIGKSIRLDGDAYRVAGVLPVSFEFPADLKIDVLTTLPVSPTASYHDRMVATWAVYGRVKDGVSLAEARADLTRLFDRSKAAFPPLFRTGTRLVFEPLQQHRVGDARKLLTILIAAVTCLLLIGFANVANLLLGQWSARFGELAIRASIGAGRGRLARQLLTEAALLSGLGCVLGLLLASGVLAAFVHYAHGELPRMQEVGLDTRVLMIGLIVSVVTTLLFGGIPAWRVGRFDIQEPLQRSARAVAPGGFQFGRRALVGAEVGLCLVLLSGAALLLQTLWHLRKDRLGFQPEHILSVAIPLKGTKLETNRAVLTSELLDFLRRVPGVEGATWTECTPLTGGPLQSTFSRSDRPRPEAFHPGDGIHVCGTGPGYAAAAGLRMVRGRYFNSEDFHEPFSLVVLNETAARTFLPGEEAIGKHVLDNHLGTGWKTVIGIVSDSKNNGLNAAPEPQAFVNGEAYPDGPEMHFIMREMGDLTALEAAIQEKLRSLDTGLIADFQPLTEEIAEVSGGARFNALLIGSFAVIAFTMAVIGVYGVLAFAVTQRTQEIGIRIALGSKRRQIFALVLREGILPVIVGMAGGVAAVFRLTRYLKAILYGVSATDLLTLVCVTAGLMVAAVVAISLPARRASTVDPAIALRHN